ncbi:hypothetical protein SDRG_12332 [Saprolegnia diclina VS20]|uniref:Ankyrin repeat domain-containing protein n=1 Tax=Saprolegnia diclina (strain VS20) TaxID=1156394 RepID=T0RJL7_SAPDV|nr:hypothetical protein SDRG_12332 [Saprolegnia diclina VS20]EQC30057.1 hypothetical protein SDRG_12332 [Saprolegnia diclina VS20]|eukprot:XP_008616624.1 hypothetical protein SDRG_12332 [Saprolegnia diclina VS20]
MAAAISVLTNDGLVRLMATYQSGLPVSLLGLDHEWKVDLAFEWVNVPGICFALRYEQRDVWSGELFLNALDARFPLHWALFTGRSDLALTYATLKCSELLTLDAIAPSVLSCAAKYGTCVTFTSLSALGFRSAQRTAIVAASYGRLDLVGILYDNWQGPWPQAAIDGACRNGHLDVLRYLCKEPCSTKGVDDAASHGHIDVLRFVHATHSVVGSPRALHLAAQHGHADVVFFLLTHQQWTARDIAVSLRNAASEGHTSIVTYLLAQYPRPVDAPAIDTRSIEIYKLLIAQHVPAALDVDALVATGNLAHVQYAFAHHLGTCSAHAMTAAARTSLQMVEFLDRVGVACAPAAIDAAAKVGALDIVAYLHTHRTDDSCTAKAMVHAAAKGHLDVVRFLHALRKDEAGYAEALDKSAAKGHLNVVQFLLTHQSNVGTANAIDGAARAGHEDVVAYLLAQGHPYTSAALDGAADGGHLAIVQRLHAAGAPATTAALDRAIVRGHIEVVTFLLAHRREGFSPVAISWARSKAMRQQLATSRFCPT